MSLSILSTSPVAGVTLAMFRSETAGPRRSEESHARHGGPRQDATPLADAMADALRRLGWTPQAPAAAAVAPAPAPAVASTDTVPGTVPVAAAVTAEAAAEVTPDASTQAPTDAPADAPEPAADLPAALAAFAEALMGALREAGGGRGRGRDRDGDGVRDHGDHGRRAWGYGRAVGVITVRLERVIGELKAALPAPAPAVGPSPADEVPPAPVDAAAPVPDAAAPASEVQTAPPVPAEPAPAEPVAIDVAPAPVPAPATAPLADAFAQLLDALRDNGAAVPAEGDPATQMIEFLQALTRGLKPEGGGTTTVTGLFIRISV